LKFWAQFNIMLKVEAVEDQLDSDRVDEMNCDAQEETFQQLSAETPSQHAWHEQLNPAPLHALQQHP
jgi:hypothetical protein